MAFRRPSPLPGFGLTLGFTVFYLSVIVLVPLGALVLKAGQIEWSEFWGYVMHPRAVAAYRLTFGASALAAGFNVLGGLLIAWVLARYDFPGRRLMDALVDVPFALPTAVGGLALASVYGLNGWVGRWVAPGSALGSWFGPEGLRLAYSRIGVVIALVFVSFPFVVRTVQPVVESLDRGLEEAAATLGASRVRTFLRVILPTLVPSLLTGFALAFARCVGEFGSIQFISSNIPFETQVAPQVIIERLDAYEIEAALSVAVFLLVVSFLILGAINLLEGWSRRFQQG
jgi:sulfate/thiosulfate transport system permease protein